jgi:hypothetical protein
MNFPHFGVVFLESAEGLLNRVDLVPDHEVFPFVVLALGHNSSLSSYRFESLAISLQKHYESVLILLLK